METLVIITNGSDQGKIGFLTQKTDELVAVNINKRNHFLKPSDIREATFSEVCQFYLKDKKFKELKINGPGDTTLVFEGNYKVRTIAAPSGPFMSILVCGEEVLATHK